MQHIKHYKNNVILIPPCATYGDCLSVIGMIYFLLDYYQNVYFYITKERKEVVDYYQHFFKYDQFYNKRIYLIEDVENLVINSEINKYDIINTHTGDWLSAKFDFINLIPHENYFNDLNPLYKKLNIPSQFQNNPNTHLPNHNIEINHLFYYKMVGLNNEVRMNFFHYSRNKEEEEKYSNSILNRLGLSSNDKYNIVNSPITDSVNIENIINNDYPIINISMLAPCPGYLLSLLENAETINFIEGSNVNFFYHCQYKKIFDYKNKINFHIWARNRKWSQYNLDYAWKMMSTPKLKNWDFIM